jgi:hypothetical protein
MGGNGKHMPHIWETYDATFRNVFDLLESLTTGEIVVTEKFDGVNIHFRVDNSGTVRFSRNLGDIKSGGFTFREALRLYQNHPARPIFIEGCRSIDEAYTDARWPFGYSGRDWMNSEIVFAESAQLLNYSKNAIVLHHPVTFLPDGKKTVDELKASKVDRLLTFESICTTTKKDWYFLGPSLVTLSNESGQGYMTSAKNRLIKCMTAAGLSEDNTLRDFLRYSLRSGPIDEIRTSSAIKDSLADKISGMNESVRLIDLKKGQPKGVASQISYYGQVKNELRHITAAMKPIINTLNAFSAMRLRNAQSVLIDDALLESQRIAELITSESSLIASHEDDFAAQRKEMFNDLLEQWNMVGTAPPAIEGITFDFCGKRTKITGGFASLNQLLGLSRYGRGTIPAVQPYKSSTMSLVEYFGLV